MNRSQKRHPERWARTEGFDPSPKKRINSLRGRCVRQEKIGDKDVTVIYRANKKGEPYRRNSGRHLTALKVI